MRSASSRCMGTWCGSHPGKGGASVQASATSSPRCGKVSLRMMDAIDHHIMPYTSPFGPADAPAGIDHQPVSCWPSTSPTEMWARGSLVDAPHMTKHYELRFCTTNPAQFHISSMPLSCLQRHPEGTILWDGNVPVGGRALGSLPSKVNTQLACWRVVCVHGCCAGLMCMQAPLMLNASLGLH